jgi:3-oxoacyl-[acyl-carrier-protein] synthase-3
MAPCVWSVKVNGLMKMSELPADGHERWMALEGGEDGALSNRPLRSRFAAIGASVPERRLTTHDLMATTRHRTRIDLERLTGIRERHIAADGEDSYTLALDAAQDALAHANCGAEDLDVLIVSSITRHVGGLGIQLEPPVSVALKEAVGARNAVSFDLSNACAGMMTGVFILNDMIRQGRISRGMVVSGEYISHLGSNAAREVRTILSNQLASLTLGDAGAAAILERAPEDAAGIEVAGFTTLSEHSRLCTAAPAKIGPGMTMHTDARAIHKFAIEASPALLQEALERAGLELDEIDYLIPHQTSVRAIKQGGKDLLERWGTAPKHWVVTVDEFGNTASTTHFVALSKYLREGRFVPEDRVLLLSLASGLEVGIVIFKIDELAGRYGHDH